MTKNKIMRYFKKAVASTLAIATSFGGVVSANMMTTFAADAKLDNDVKIVSKGLKYDDSVSYIAKNVNKSTTSLRKASSSETIKNGLKQTGYSIRLKQLIAEKSKIPNDCTIDTLWKKHSDAFISQYIAYVPLYDLGNNFNYYVANLSSANINGTGKIYDAAFVNGLDNVQPDVIKDVKFDESTGLAYIPKSYYKNDKNTLITGQVMYAGTIENQKITIDTTVENESNIVKQAIEANRYDVTIKIPITESKLQADKLKLSDFDVYLNGAERAIELNNDNAVFHQSTGVLELSISPATITAVKVKVKNIGVIKSVSRLLGRNVNAAIKNPDKLNYVLDKTTGKPIVFDKIDVSKLQVGQIFNYKNNMHYEEESEMNKIVAGTWKDPETGKKATRNYQAKTESVLHTRKFLYIPNCNSDDAWFKIYNNGSTFSNMGGVVRPSNYKNTCFYIPVPAGNCKVTASNKNKATLNFHQTGSFNTKFTPAKYPKANITYTAQHMYAGECAHITNPLGYETGKTRLSILHVDKNKGYVVVGFNCARTNIQSGFGIYKFAIPTNGHVYLKKSSANTSITNGSSCYSLANAEYGVYTEKACINKVATLKTDANGKSQVVQVEPGTYYVKGARRFLINERS